VERTDDGGESGLDLYIFLRNLIVLLAENGITKHTQFLGHIFLGPKRPKLNKRE